MKKELICIECPTGCRLEAALTGQAFTISGNSCEKGKEYALRELTNPTRALTSTVRTIFSDCPLLPVKTGGEVSLQAFPQIMAMINAVLLDKRLSPGEPVLEEIPGFGVSLLATADMQACPAALVDISEG